MENNEIEHQRIGKSIQMLRFSIGNNSNLESANKYTSETLDFSASTKRYRRSSQSKKYAWRNNLHLNKSFFDSNVAEEMFKLMMGDISKAGDELFGIKKDDEHIDYN